MFRLGGVLLALLTLWGAANAQFFNFPPGTFQSRAALDASGGVAWTPATEGANLVGWWKTTAGVTPGTNGSSTTSWADQSGNGNGLTGYSSNSFNCTASGTTHTSLIYGTSSFNTSYPGITQDLSVQADCFQTTSTITGINTATFSAFVTSAPYTSTHGTGADNGRVISVCSSGNVSNDYDNANSFVIYHASGGNTINLYGNNAARGSAFTTTDGAVHTWGAIFDGANVTFYVDGAAQGSASAWVTNIGDSGGITVAFFAPCVGAPGSSGAGIMAEGVIFKNAINPANYHTYAQSTWGAP